MLDPLANAHIGAAAANIPGHRRIDVPIVGRGILREQRRGRHDLPGLAVPALHDLEIEPRLLDLGACGCRSHALYRGDGPIADRAHGELTGSDRDAVQMNRACAAQGNPATEFRARHPENVTQHPQERHLVGDIDTVLRAVDGQFFHEWSSSPRRLRVPPAQAGIAPPAPYTADPTRRPSARSRIFVLLGSSNGLSVSGRRRVAYKALVLKAFDTGIRTLLKAGAGSQHAVVPACEGVCAEKAYPDDGAS